MSMISGSLICWRGSFRPMVFKPRAAMLGMLSIALGVAVFLAITIANRSAMGSFRQAFSIITGSADLEIRGSIPEEVLPEVQACEGVAIATPLVEAMVTLPENPGESLHLIGIDPLSAADLFPLRPSFGSAGQGDLSEWLARDDGLAVTEGFLKHHHLRQGDSISLQGPGEPRRLQIRYIARNDAMSSDGSAGVAAMDLGAAQEWVGKTGTLSAILIRLRDPKERKDVVERLRAHLPADVQVEPPSRRTQQVEIMLSAFRLNLSALSLVSLMVGMFFVGNSAAAAVVRRRVSLGIMRAMGTGRGTILGLVLVESAFSGVVGSAMGVLLSPLLAAVLARPVAQTVTALYLPVDTNGGWPTPLEALVGIIVGTGASMLASWIPARQAAGVDPSKVLHPGSAQEIFPLHSGKLALVGFGLLVGALVFSLGALNGGTPLLGFVAAFCVMAGFSLWVPLTMVFVAYVLRMLNLRQWFPGGVIVRIALEQTMRSLHRTAPTIAALAAAAAMTVGISVMIHSFRGSVVAWAERTLTADLFIAPAANELLGLEHTLPEGAAAWWAKRPEVSAVGTFREIEARTVEDQQVTLGVVAGPSRGSVDFLHGEVDKKMKALVGGGTVALSESLGRRLNLGPGDRLKLRGPGGPLSLKVVDLYRDYTRDRGIAMIDADYFARIWGTKAVNSLAVVFHPGTPQETQDQAIHAFYSGFGGKGAYVCYSNRSLKARILEIFNQTFAVTAVLKSISIAVAVGGVMLTLGILVMERARDLGVLRSLGASKGQIVRMMLCEAMIIGMIASIVGLASGAVLALVLTWVVNKAFFGWSIDLAYPWWEMCLLPLWMTAAALVAGYFPANGAAKTRPAAALRTE